MKTAGSKATAGVAGKAPRPLAKRGNSLNPARMKTSSAADLTGPKGVGSIGTAADSMDFSKRSKLGMARIEDEETKARPGTEFLPSASQEFGE